MYLRLNYSIKQKVGSIAHIREYKKDESAFELSS